MVTGCGIETLLVAYSVIALFSVASLALPFVAVAIWRSASNYPQAAWWQKLLAWGAKLCGAFSGLLGALSVVGLLYLASDFIRAVMAPD